MNDEPGRIAGELQRLVLNSRSLMLATVDANGTPLASYTPYWADGDGNFYVFVSELSEHTQPMSAGTVLSVMIIEDESAAANIYARRRAGFCCEAEPIARNDPRWTPAIAGLKSTAGETVALLEQLGDFRLFGLSPGSYRLVLGFGQAYRISGGRVEHINPSARQRPGAGDTEDRP